MPSGTFAVLWDVDGTLVDTAELHFQAWCALAGELAKPFSRADFAGTFGWRNPEIIPRLFGTNYSAGEVTDLGNRKEDLYRAEAAKGVTLLPARARSSKHFIRRGCGRRSAPARRGPILK